MADVAYVQPLHPLLTGLMGHLCRAPSSTRRRPTLAGKCCRESRSWRTDQAGLCFTPICTLDVLLVQASVDERKALRPWHQHSAGAQPSMRPQAVQQGLQPGDLGCIHKQPLVVYSHPGSVTCGRGSTRVAGCKGRQNAALSLDGRLARQLGLGRSRYDSALQHGLKATQSITRGCAKGAQAFSGEMRSLRSSAVARRSGMTRRADSVRPCAAEVRHARGERGAPRTSRRPARAPEGRQACA
jgi:hypothetical protein